MAGHKAVTWWGSLRIRTEGKIPAIAPPLVPAISRLCTKRGKSKGVAETCTMTKGSFQRTICFLFMGD